MLVRLAAARGESLAALSRMLRRNPAYLQQFVQRGSPRRLADDDIVTLADHFGVEASLLGGAAPAGDLVAIPYLSVRASAGRGLSAEGEAVIRTEPFARSLLRDAGIAPADASMIAAEGESMEPTILSGDRLLVDRAERMVRDGSIYVVRYDQALSVKRLERDGAALRLVSDNPAFPPVRVPRAELAVIGAVKLLIRRPA